MTGAAKFVDIRLAMLDPIVSSQLSVAMAAWRDMICSVGLLICIYSGGANTHDRANDTNEHNASVRNLSRL